MTTSGLRCFSAVQPGPVAGRALMRQGTTKRHAACGFSIMLERCMHAMGDRGCACACACVQRQRGPCFLCRSDLATSLYLRYGTWPHRGGSGRVHSSTIIHPSSGSSIAPLAIVLLTGAGCGQAVDEREPWVTSSRVRVYKPKVSHLFAFAPNRVRHSGCCMAPLFFFKPNIPLGRRTVMYLVPLYHPHACCSAPHAQLIVVPELRAQLLGKTRCEPDQKLGAPFTPDSW